jgi:hypothetical protein
LTPQTSLKESNKTSATSSSIQNNAVRSPTARICLESIFLGCRSKMSLSERLTRT